MAMTEEASAATAAAIAPRQPEGESRGAWRKYWIALSQPWRTEPEIDDERRQFLAERQAITPNISQDVYPFKGVALARADVEWLLAAHDGGRGPVDWSDSAQRERVGLDLRGADLRAPNLRALPLARLIGGLEGAKLYGAHLENASLVEAQLAGAFLRRVHFEGASLAQAHCAGKRLAEDDLRRVRQWKPEFPDVLPPADFSLAFFDAGTVLQGIVLGNQTSGFVSLADVCRGDVNLSVVRLRRERLGRVG